MTFNNPEQTSAPKPTVALIAPVFSLSGYGKHAVMIANALIKLDKYDLKIYPTPWASTPQTGLRSDDPDHVPILQRVASKLDFQPDISIQISVPSDFRPIGKTSIGITALTEANFAPPTMIEGCNRVNLVIVPSKFSKSVLTETIIEKRENDRLVDTLRFSGNCEVLFEGISTDIFNKTNIVKGEVVNQLNAIEEDFAYLFVGHYLSGNLGHDRKNVGMLIKTFLETFRDKKKRPALVLKTSGAGFSNVERDDIIEKINQIQELVMENGSKRKLPNIYLLNGELSDDEMNTLYNHPKIKSMVSFTRGEGYGIPLAEFSTTGKPIIVSNYSGHLDFLHPEYNVLLPGSLGDVDNSAVNEWIPKGSQWFMVNYPLAAQKLVDVYEHYDKYLEKSRKQPKYTRDNFSHDAMTVKLGEILDKYCAPPQKLTIKLPELKKLT